MDTMLAGSGDRTSFPLRAQSIDEMALAVASPHLPSTPGSFPSRLAIANDFFESPLPVLVRNFCSSVALWNVLESIPPLPFRQFRMVFSNTVQVRPPNSSPANFLKVASTGLIAGTGSTAATGAPAAGLFAGADSVGGDTGNVATGFASPIG